jgi:molybdopterin synthase catalytic subunit
MQGATQSSWEQVRADEINGENVRAIEYSAYEAMVSVEADKIKYIILSEFADTKTIDIVHSTGPVNAGEISLFVLVSAGHRKQAIEACSKTVERIKEKFQSGKKKSLRTLLMSGDKLIPAKQVPFSLYFRKRLFLYFFDRLYEAQ